jgi:transcription elongation factor GreA
MKSIQLHGGPIITTLQSDPTTLSQALTQYLANRSFPAWPDTQQELSKFVRWCGRDRSVAGLTPQEAAEYGDLLTASARGQENADRAQAVKEFLSFCFRSKFTETPLAKHVKVRKTGRKPTSRKKGQSAIDITPEGYQSLSEELETLRGERVTVAQDIRRAAADKDFRENAPLDAARERQGHLEARIRELEDSLQRARLVSPDAQDSVRREERRVKLGSKVKLLDSASGEEMAYTLVNASEANPMDSKLSVASPVGKALIGHRAGEEVEVATPRGNLSYRVKGIE